MTIIRYTDGGPEGWMQSPTGEFVLYEDYAKALSARLQDLEEIKQERLTWAMTCGCECASCLILDATILGDVPTSEKQP